MCLARNAAVALVDLLSSQSFLKRINFLEVCMHSGIYIVTVTLLVGEVGACPHSYKVQHTLTKVLLELRCSCLTV